MRHSILLLLVLLAPACAVAQTWVPNGYESFETLAGAADGSLLLVRAPGDILRSADTGATWQVVHRGGFRV